MTFPTCASCEHFRIYPGERKGRCYGAIPIQDSKGAQMDYADFIKSSRPACVAHKPLPEGMTTLEHGKVDPETPRMAVKLAYLEGKGPPPPPSTTFKGKELVPNQKVKR